MFLHRFRTQHWVLLSAVLFVGLLLLLPQGATSSLAAQAAATLPPATPGPNYMPLIYKMPTPTPVPGWEIEYYSNRTLAGAPSAVETKTYLQPAEEWGTGGPAALGGVVNDFSVRLSRSIPFDAGAYAFYLTTDDGARLYIDGVLVIDRWHGSLRGTATYRHQQTMTAGAHDIVIEYYEEGGDARLRLQWFNETEHPNTQWRAEYYSNENLSGAPAVVRNESDIDFSWGSSSPAPGIPADHFSARFTRPIYFNGGTRILYTEADDRVRVWVDKWAPGTELIDAWDDDARWHSANQSMNEAGWYFITIEYAEATSDARLRYFDLYGSSRGSWGVEYFDDYDWKSSHQGNPDILTNESPDASENRVYSNEPGINLDAGDMPDNIDTDDFAVRFTRYFDLKGKHKFRAEYDDGVRVWVDGVLIIDKWKSEGGMAVQESSTIDLHDGPHVIKVEFYDGAGAAICRVTWRKV